MRSQLPRDAPAEGAVADQVAELRALYTLTDRLYRARAPAQVYEAALDAITGTLGCERASILLFDDAGVMRFEAWRGLSDDYRRRLEGHSPWKPGEPEPEPIFVADIAATDEADWVKEAIAAEGIHALGFVPIVAQGTVVGKFMTYYPAPHAFAEHETELAVTIARQVGFSVERARNERSRQLAEAELRESEARFRLAVEAAPSGMVMTDGTGRIVMVNANAEALFGYSREELEGHPIELLVPGRFKPTHPAYREKYGSGPSARAMGNGRDLFALRKDGSELPVEIGLSPIETPTGPMAIAAVVDISGRKRADAQRELLLAELNHRVKNTLAVVQAIAHQTFKGSGQDARRAFEGRLSALASAHNLLTRANWESASLERLANEALHAEGPNRQRVALAGPPVSLPPKQALAIALALHELFINAVKHGALSSESGRVELEWVREDRPEPRLRLVWREAGGPEVSAPERRGFGSLLIERALAQDLQGTVVTDYAADGLVCTIEAPLPSVAAAS